MVLPSPEINITTPIASIIQAFQNLSQIGMLRERWIEIKTVRNK
jgi:hypothetical protein